METRGYTEIRRRKAYESNKTRSVPHFEIENMYHLGQILASLPTENRYWALQNLEEVEKSWEHNIKLKRTPLHRNLTSQLRRIEYETSSMLEDLDPVDKWKNFVIRYGNTVRNYCLSVDECCRAEVLGKIKNIIHIWVLNTKAQGNEMNVLMGMNSCGFLGYNVVV